MNKQRKKIKKEERRERTKAGGKMKKGKIGRKGGREEKGKERMDE